MKVSSRLVEVVKVSLYTILWRREAILPPRFVGTRSYDADPWQVCALRVELSRVGERPSLFILCVIAMHSIEPITKRTGFRDRRCQELGSGSPSNNVALLEP